MKVFSIEIKALSNVFILHSLSSHHFGTNLLCLLGQSCLVSVEPFAQFFGILLGKEDLVDDNVVAIDSKFGQFLDQTFRFVNREEFGNADTDLSTEKKWEKLEEW